MNAKAYLAGLVTALAMSSPVAAGPFYIDIGEDRSGDGSTSTHNINKLEASTTLFTSFFEIDGNRVFDTNRADAMNNFGFGAAAGQSNPSTAPDTSTFRYAENSGTRQDSNITGFSPSGVPSIIQNNFSSADWTVATTPNGATPWGLSVDYYLAGTYDPTASDIAGSVSYNQGWFDIFFEEQGTTDRIQVLRVDVTGSSITAGDVELFGNVSYDFLAAPDTFVENFFVDADSGESFYQLAGVSEIPIHWVLDTNVRALGSIDDLLALNGQGEFEGTSFGMRQTTGNAGMAFQVPEPGVLMLMGTGLLLLGLTLGGFTRRRNTGGDLAS